jgi:N-acetylmuramic acid 6-phosphate (MurNAc-6-P) etherase
MSTKLRTLFQDIEEQEICLKDVIDAYIDASDQVLNLEYKNSKHALTQVKIALNKCARIHKEFYKRIRLEVEPEVLAYASKRDKAHTKNIENLKGYIK